MEELTLRAFAEARGAAIVAGDIEHAMADLCDEVRGYLAPIAAEFPDPTTAAEVVAVELIDAESSVVLLRYTGEGAQSTTVRSFGSRSATDASSSKPRSRSSGSDHRWNLVQRGSHTIARRLHRTTSRPNGDCPHHLRSVDA